MQPPPWPLERLSSKDKEVRLRYLISNLGFVYDEEPVTSQRNLGKKICESWLSNMSTMSFLEPTRIVNSRDDKIPDDVISRCHGVEIDRVWFSWSKGALVAGTDKEFDEKSIEEKDAAADFYYEKNGEIEFYDVSSFYPGQQVWATFAEQGRVVCNADRGLCGDLEGYRLTSPVVVSAVVDAETCTPLASSKAKVGERLRAKSSKPYAYEETASLYGLAEMEGSLVRVGVTALHSLDDTLLLLTDDGSVTIIVEKISGDKGICKFSSMEGNPG